MTRLYVALGIIGLLFVSHLGAYFKGRSDVSDKARIEQLERDLKAVQDAYDQEQKARREDARQALQDAEAARIDDASRKELEDALDDPDADVFGAPDADGLRKLINRQNP